MKTIFSFIAVAIVAGVGAALTGSSGWSPVAPSSIFIAGAVVNQSAISTLTRGFKALFTKFYDAAEPPLLPLAMEVTSTNGEEEYGWLEAMTELREWIGDRVVESLAVAGYVLRNKQWEKTIGVKKTDIEDDRLGIYEPRLKMLATQAKRHPVILLIKALLAGETEICHDGVAFFATNHPNGDQPDYANLATGSALTATNYEAARTAMMALVNAAGESLGIVPNTLIVPPQLEKIAREILHAGTVIGDAVVGGSKTNVWLGSANLIVDPRLSSKPGEWYLADLTAPFKPFIIQTRKPMALTSLTKDDDENVFMKGEYLYGVDWRGAVGYALPQLIYKSRA